jgi:hypothetical protein
MLFFNKAFTFAALAVTTSLVAACDTCEDGGIGGIGGVIAVGANIGVTAQVHTVVDVLGHLKTQLTDACAPFRASTLLSSQPTQTF